MKKILTMILSVLPVAFLSTAFIPQKQTAVDNDVGISFVISDDVQATTADVIRIATIGESDFSCTQEILLTAGNNDLYVYENSPGYVCTCSYKPIHRQSWQAMQTSYINYRWNNCIPSDRDNGATRLDIGEIQHLKNIV